MGTSIARVRFVSRVTGPRRKMMVSVWLSFSVKRLEKGPRPLGVNVMVKSTLSPGLIRTGSSEWETNSNVRDPLDPARRGVAINAEEVSGPSKVTVIRIETGSPMAPQLIVIVLPGCRSPMGRRKAPEPGDEPLIGEGGSDGNRQDAIGGVLSKLFERSRDSIERFSQHRK